MPRFTWTAVFLLAGSLVAADFASEGKLWWAHVRFLADDSLAGRETGSDGLRKAEQYVAKRFERLELIPAGASGAASSYLQPVGFESRQVVAAESNLELVREGGVERLAFAGDGTPSAPDIILNLRGEPSAALEAPLVFAGYGMAIPEAGYDDTAGLDLRGKIAVYVNALPPVQASANVKSHYSSGVERWNAFRKAGAVGMAAIALQDAREGGAQTRAGESSGPPPGQMVLADRNLQEGLEQRIAITITRRAAPRFLAASGHTIEEIERLARQNAPLPAFPLNLSLGSKLAIQREIIEDANVAAFLEGSDPKLKTEYVILSAHLDHLGLGRPADGGSIYHGAMDDASGVASLLEIARLLKGSGARPKRSILFLAVTAEENGELGSRFFIAHPPVPARQIVADINLDMFLPLYPLKAIEVQGLAESSLGEQIRTAAAGLGVQVQTDREPDQNRFIRSDQYSFIRRGVPSLAFKFGYEFGSPEETIRKDWVRDRYHKPSDDLSQPVDQEAAARFDRVILDLLERVADDPARPAWNPDSFFKRFAH